MDYLKTSFGFRLRKVVRYLALYGPGRTWEKVRAQHHMRTVYGDTSTPDRPARTTARIGIVGCGAFAYSTIAYYLRREENGGIRATMDVDLNRARSLGERARATYWTTDVRRLLNDADISLVYIASNHSTHAPYAVAALERGKHVHIEKPPVVDEEQLRNLVVAMSRSAGGVQLGYNRPVSHLGRRLLEALAKEQGPTVMNWFVAGHAIEPEHWYFSPSEGGRVLGNLCHWIDFTFQAIPRECRWPLRIVPARADRSDCNVAVSYVFQDGSVGVVSFSAMGHTFDGVKERCSVQKGHTLITLDDFRIMVVDVAEKKTTVRLRYRDHGHQAAIRRSLDLLRTGKAGGVTPEYVWETGLLMMRTKAALESGREVVLDAPREYTDLVRGNVPASADHP